MRHVTLALLSLVLAHAAFAEECAPDAVLDVAKDRIATLVLRDGGSLVGTVASYDFQRLVIVERGTGSVKAIARCAIVDVRLSDGVLAPVSLPSVSVAPEKARHVGIQVSQGPGNVLLDLDYGHFYAFVGTSIGYPFIFKGNYDDDQYFGFAVGAGYSWKMSATSHWKFDLLATLTPTWWTGFSMGVGVSPGFHYTSPSGVTVAFRVPLIGVAPGCNKLYGFDDGDGGNCVTHNGASALFGNYYLQAAMSQSLFSIGYRF